MSTNVLVVDDEADIREMIGLHLRKTGFNTLTVGSAEEAIDQLKANDIQLVVTDISLPGMNGLNLLRFIKSRYDTEVIVITGFSQDHSYEEAANGGAGDFILKPVRIEELSLRIRRLLDQREVRKTRDEVVENLREMVITDSLTGIYNSRHFYNQLTAEMTRASRYAHTLSLLLLDIDHFKEYNDSFGHLQGDQALARVGKVLQSCLRSIDSAYRYGGEEFTVILPETGIQEATTVAERVRDAMAAETFQPELERTARLTVSVGVTEYRRGESPETFVQRADQAMYRCKRCGRNRVEWLLPRRKTDPEEEEEDQDDG